MLSLPERVFQLKDISTMTDSIQTTLRLDRIPALDRKFIPAHLCTVTDLLGKKIDTYIKPSQQKSPLADTQTKWIVRCRIDRYTPELDEIPYQIDADLNIPNALTGQNLEHGTSVYAAGIAALEMQRIWMARAGIGRAVLDLLTADCVELRGVTITYLHRCDSQEDADQWVRKIAGTGKILNGKCELRDSTNITVILPYRTFTIKIYNKTILEHCKFPADAPKDDLISNGQCLVRIEVLLKAEFLDSKLKGKSRKTLNSWRDAYAEGLYELIYEMTVVKKLGLGLKPLRHRAPRPEVYSQLSQTEGDFLRWHIDGNPAREFKSVVESGAPISRYSELRLAVLKVARVDVEIPWDQHTQLSCYELAPKFGYPGDYYPSDDRAPWSFCKENWPVLRQRLRDKYERAIAYWAEVSEPQEQTKPVVLSSLPTEQPRPVAQSLPREQPLPSVFPFVFERAQVA